MVAFIAAKNRWDIWSLDLSTAFLQGFTFSELESSGFKRQPCAFIPPKDPFDFWEMIKQLDPKMRGGDGYAFELHKAAYGLKDAPLLWNLRIAMVIIKVMKLKRSAHDGCVYYLIRKENLVLILSLHVDDTLLSGSKMWLEWCHSELEKHFGKLKKECSAFRHFGVDVKRMSDGSIALDQTEYLKLLKPITLPRCNQLAAASETQLTDFRSLVSGIAWVGVTSPEAQACASLLQGFTGELIVKQIHFANNSLAQLKAQYTPLVLRAGHVISHSKLVCIGDSSLGNSSKYSQGGYLIFICNDSDSAILHGPVTLISWKSAKSKRVATSSMAAETLLMTSMCEEALYLQAWIEELRHPMMTVHELINADPMEMIPVDTCTDCMDLYGVLIKPAAPSPTNRNLTLYLAQLRADRETRHVRNVIWLDTRDMLANGMTKLNATGTVDSKDLAEVLATGRWRPSFKWMHNGIPQAGSFKMKTWKRLNDG